MGADMTVLATGTSVAPRSRLRTFFDTARGGFWLGWKIESNWTDAFRFLTYQIARPVGGALILVFMYYAVARGNRGPVLGFFVVGTAFWPLVLGGVQATVRGVLEDREAFRMIRPIYTSPISYRAYLLGRSLAGQAAWGSAAVFVTLAVGVIFLHVHLTLTAASVGLVLAATVLGVAGILAIGLLCVGAAFSTTHDAWQMPEAIGAALFLVCGAIFPLTVLPSWLRAFGAAFPLSWWLEAVRRALLPATAPRSFPSFGTPAVFGMLVLTTIGAAFVCAGLFSLAERRARALGKLDRETAF